MNKLYPVIIVIICLCSALFIKQQINRNSDLNWQSDQLRSVLIERNYVEQKLWLNTLKMKDFSLPEFNPMHLRAQSEGNIDVHLRDVLPGKRKVFFRYAELGCNTCTEQVIAMIAEMNVKVIYLASYEQKNYMSTFKRMNKINQEVFNLKDQQLFPLDSLKIPYIFVSDKTDRIVDAHIPISDDLSFTSEFLESLLKD